MSDPAETSTRPGLRGSRLDDLGALEFVRRLPGRNRTKADILVYRATDGQIAVKDYGDRPWWVRQSLGRFLIRRETAAYRAAGPIRGLPRFHGRLGPFSLATEYVEARRLAEFEDGAVDGARFDRLEAIVGELHQRGVALADLSHRDVLVAEDDSVHVIDLAMAWVRGPRPGRMRRRLFEHFRVSDLFGLARLRARFAGESSEAAVAGADRAAVAWHRRARRIKWIWDRLRGAERLPPGQRSLAILNGPLVTNRTQDETARAPGRPYNRTLGLLRLVAVYALIGGMLAFARPTPRGVGMGLVLVAAGEALRFWAAGHLTKTERLITAGPYRYSRNPLYLGRLSIFSGLCLMARLPYGLHWLLLAAGHAVFFGYYLPRKERVEPARLREAHGDRYERYFRAVPSLLPALRPYPDATPSRWSIERLLRNREHWMVIGLAAVASWLIWRT